MTSLDKFSLRESGIDIPGLLDSDPWDFKKSQFIGKLRKIIKILNKRLKISKQNCKQRLVKSVRFSDWGSCKFHNTRPLSTSTLCMVYQLT